MRLLLEGLGGRAVVVAGLLEVRDGLERGPALRIELGEHALVTADGGVDVLDALGEHLGFAQGDLDLARNVGRRRFEPTEQDRALGELLALGGVGDEQLDGLGVLDVLEHLLPDSAGGVLVEQVARVDGASLLARGDADAPVVRGVGALRENGDELGPALGGAVLLHEPVRVLLVGRVEIHRSLEVCERAGIVSRVGEVIGATRQMVGLRLRIGGQLGALARHLAGVVPAFGLEERLLGGVP